MCGCGDDNVLTVESPSRTDCVTQRLRQSRWKELVDGDTDVCIAPKTVLQGSANVITFTLRVFPR